MNYSQYLQSGGSMQAPMSDEQALAHKKEVDNQMAEAIKQNPASLDQAIQEYGENAPSFIKHMIDVAAENQDEELLEILKPYAEKFNIMSFRCGGKVRAKIKKARCGKKMEKGGEAPIKKEVKGGKQPCPCTLHKVGGKLIEVDCNGVPVLKAADGDKLPPAQASPAVKAYMTAKPISTAMPFSDQWFGDLGNTFVKKMNTWQTGLQKKNPSFWGSPTQPATPAPQPATSQPAIGSEEWKAQQRANQEAYNKSPEGQEAIRKADEAIAARKAAQSASVQPVQSKYQGLFSGDLRSLDARKKWVADNANYLKAQGWTDEDITGYRGQANLNMKLSRQISGADAWNQQQNQSDLTASKANENLTILKPEFTQPQAVAIPQLPQNIRQYQLELSRWNNNAKTDVGQALNRMAIANKGKNAFPQIRKNGGLLSYKNYLNL